jgi:hypothetical protein
MPTENNRNWSLMTSSTVPSKPQGFRTSRANLLGTDFLGLDPSTTPESPEIRL